MALGKVNIGLIPALLPTIIQLMVVDHLIFIVMLIIGVGIGFTSTNLLHITIV